MFTLLTGIFAEPLLIHVINYLREQIQISVISWRGRKLTRNMTNSANEQGIAKNIQFV